MKRAIIATAATTVGLIALLSYKSGGTGSGERVSVGGTGSNDSSGTSGTIGTSVSTTLPASTSGTSGATSTTAGAVAGKTTTSAGAERDVLGDDVNYLYGDIQVELTLDDRRIVRISLPEDSSPDPRSYAINSQAVPILEREALSAQGVNFDAVSGATFTSDAFARSLESALDKAGL